MIKRRIPFRIIYLCALILLTGVVDADMIMPTLTYVYFDKDGIPYNGSVNYTVSCYGYAMDYHHVTLSPGSYQPQLIYGYSVNYAGYGSPDYHQSYLQYSHIDWCDLDGVANGRDFTIGNITPVSRRNTLMQRVSRNTGGHQIYYYVTPEYASCRYFEREKDAQWTIDSNNFSRINSTGRLSTVLQLPGRNLLYGILPRHQVFINRSDLGSDLERYIAYLETCRVNTDPACPGWIADGKPLKTFREYRSLNKNATYMREHPCDTFLLEQDPSLVLPFIAEYRLLDHPCIDADANVIPCNLTGTIEESRFTLPADVDPGSDGFRSTLVLPTTDGNADIHRSPVESLYCVILSRFSISCENT